MNLLPTPALLLALFLLVCSASAEVTLVQDGKPSSAIVLDESASELCRLAAAQLQHHIRLASGATLPIVTAAGAKDLSTATAQIFVGPSDLANSAGAKLDALQPEEYVVQSDANWLLLAGKDLGRFDLDKRYTIRHVSPATLYAVCHLLDHQLGVRWLWPGDDGTYVPRRPTIAIGNVDVKRRPPLEVRNFRLPPITSGFDPTVLDQQAALWTYHHQGGSERSDLDFGHSFGKWWKRYHQTHPDYFAKTPPDVTQPSPSPRTFKLCVSNPEVAEQIIAQWTSAGRPDVWNVCPNDGSGYCICERCRALDAVQHPSTAAVWRGYAPLTGRYVALWNTLVKRMRRENPGVRLCSYAYHTYGQPLPGMCLEKGLYLGLVPGYDEKHLWHNWQHAGANLLLRPNWWHAGAIAPHLPLHEAGNFFRFAQEHRMVGFDFDAVLGHWGTQGAFYYLIARLSTHPELTVDEVIDEYALAFGAAGDTVKKYLEYWESFSMRAAYPRFTGGGVMRNPKGLYALAHRKHGLPGSHHDSGWLILPYLYTDDVLDPATAILDEAKMLAKQDPPVVQRRVQFLREGLKHLQLTCDLVKQFSGRSEWSQDDREKFRRCAARLKTMRNDLTSGHVLWGNVVLQSMPKKLQQALR